MQHLYFLVFTAGGVDYFLNRLTVDFSTGDVPPCLVIDLNDDSDREDCETFLLVLTTDDPYVALFPATATVIIYDDESMCYYCVCHLQTFDSLAERS